MHAVSSKRKWKKILLSVVAVVVVLVVAALAAVFAVWRNEIGAVTSIQMLRDRNDAHLDGAVYTMQVKGGFYLDEFVEQGGVSSDSELIQFITDRITKGVIKMDMSAPEIGCSSFTAATQDGDVLFARNYDFSKTNTMLVFTEANEGRHASISTVDLQFLGIDVDQNLTSMMDKITCLAAPYAPLDGVNDAGVSCGIYMTYQGGDETIPTDQNTDKPDFTSTTLLRLILDYADNVEEAVEIASSYDLHDSAETSYHYMVADASGRSAILEWTADDAVDTTDNDGSQRTLKVIYNDQDASIGQREADSSYQVVTNFVLQPGYYDGVPAENKKGADRYDRLYQELQAVSGVVPDEQAAMDILQIVGRRSWDNDDKNGCTVHSAVYNLTDRSVLWVTNENYDDPAAVFTFSLKD
ncbi:MAG: C45 family peptidase [Evtepia sp.]|uniref:C45 family peptidase n=1 Tax=Evtepia sp. TaxID=2773933 RepID=UPI002A75FB24|nr:C45 family peptidase [Evtepia sp.]MDY3015220.1 C45 family peptidase [Evtepia sp.]